MMTDKDWGLLLFAIAAGAAFALWVGSFSGGVFATLALIIIGDTK